MEGLQGKEVNQPGAYEWVDAAGRRHIGFLFKNRRGLMHGSFVREDGSSRAISLDYGNGEFCEGVFYGPLPPQC